LPEVVGPFGEAELTDSGTHGPGTDQRDPPTSRCDSADLFGKVADPGRVEPAIGAGEHAGPDLDDPGSRREDHFVSDQVAGHRNHDLSSQVSTSQST
jgi:hypothetical protein